MKEPKDKGVAYALWFAGMFGLPGLQRIYLGRYFSGFFYLFTCGGLVIGQLLDLVLIPGMVEEENGKYLALHGGSSPALHVQPNVPALVYAPDKPEAMHVIILRVCRDRDGATLSDCVIETGAEIGEVKTMVRSLITQELLYVHNRDSDGAVVYIAV